MPVRIPEVCLAEPAVTPFAILGGTNHAQSIPEMAGVFGHAKPIMVDAPLPIAAFTKT